MKKTLLVLAIAASTLTSINAQAFDYSVTEIDITNMRFYNGPSLDEVMQANGTLFADGSGSVDVLDSFFGYTWSATQETLFMDNTGSWSGSTGGVGSNPIFDYNDEIAAMEIGQIGVGLFFDWNNTSTAVLTIFDCAGGGGTVENPSFLCTTANPITLDNGPFSGPGSGSEITLNAVPVPAAVWLFGSGLIGLLVSARRKRKLL